MSHTNDDDSAVQTPAEFGADHREWMRKPAAPQDAAPPNISIRSELARERAQITSLITMLSAIADVLFYSDDEDCEMHSSVVRVSARLLGDCDCRLQAIESRLPGTEVTVIT
jgi:hypothetical protein